MHLVVSIQTVQSDLYTVRTSLSQSLDKIVNNVSALEKNSENCTTCHHKPEVYKDLENLHSLIQNYQRALSYYITASANIERIDGLKLNAAAMGDKLLGKTEEMSAQASSKLKLMTSEAMIKINRAKTILYVTLVLSALLGIFISVKLAMAIIMPINELVKGVRALSLGEMGYKISYKDSTEFGELADVFNKMSVALEDGYAKLRDEIIEREQTEKALRQSEDMQDRSPKGC
ncbi:MAG: methyl-accepting chemotaxis protein [Nitrospirota bacterium]